MPSHGTRNLIIIAGVVLLVVQGAVLVCWWKLPAWAPEWVVTHSPWPEPALRAVRQHPGLDREISARLVDFGPAIGPELLRQYGNGNTYERQLMLVLATELAGKEGVRAESGAPPPRFSHHEITVLRGELVELGRLAFTEGTLELAETASFLAAYLCDRRLTPLMCAMLQGQPTPIGPEVSNIVTALGVLADPRAVGTLVPLLPIRHRTHPEVERALERCQDDSTFPQVLAALRHVHPVVRTWAAHQLQRYVMPGTAGPAHGTLKSARQAVAGASVLQITRQEGDLFAQLAQLQALGTLRFMPARAYLRERTRHSDDRILGISIIALGELGDAAEFTWLLALLQEDDEDIARKARIALGHLPLTAQQHSQVDVIWEARKDVAVPTAPASPAAPQVVP